MRKKTIHIISHSHWDREWYMPFEKHRIKLVRLVDDCLELFDEANGFESFHLDGQTIVMDDYLEIKPENIDQLKKNVKEGKFHVGPWYILQDEFLTNGESTVRNLLVGMEEAHKYGEVCNVGYFPDAFGNAGQMPQILKQAGMEAVAFGRGVKPVGFNNTVEENGDYESSYSEMIWSSPDGSGLLGILFANWYNNGAEIPVDEVKAKKFWDAKLADVLRYASTDHLLFMNGCDHQPVQKNLVEAIAVAKRLYPELEFKHSNFKEYIKCVKESQDNKLTTVTGELTSQSTDGWSTLVNTTSAHIYLKQLNKENEVALINLAEPLAAIAAGNGGSYPHADLKYAWKKLMQNHPHDSICGCSVDEVNEEMVIRNKKSIQVSEELIKESLRVIGSKIDTLGFDSQEAYPFVVFNTSGWQRTGVVSVVIDIERNYHINLTKSYHQMNETQVKSLVLVDHKGNQIPCNIKDQGVKFGYDLPDDKFRQPYMARQVEVTFEAEAVPSMGYKAYALVPERASCLEKKSLVIPDGMENKYLRATINPNGTINLLDKETGKLYEQICYYEDTGDIGNEYIYRQPEGDTPIVSKDTVCSIRLAEDEEYRATYQITQKLEIPESADETLWEEQKSMTNIQSRKAKRSGKLTILTINTLISLEKNGHGIKVCTEFINSMKDHRLRVVIPTGINAQTHLADSVFEIVERPNRHAATWKNPSACEHQQCFVGIADQDAGIAVANFGLYEYEMLPEDKNAIAVTILRAVGEMGDWGVFPTPGAQCQGKCSASFEIIPFSLKAEEFDPIAEAYQFQIPMLTSQTALQKGALPMEKSYLQWHGEGIYLTTIKNKQNTNHQMVRWFNGTKKESTLHVKCSDLFNRYYRSNVIEDQLQDLAVDENGEIIVTMRPFEIFTMGLANE
jgi:alpha-mannosidase